MFVALGQQPGVCLEMTQKCLHICSGLSQGQMFPDHQLGDAARLKASLSQSGSEKYQRCFDSQGEVTVKSKDLNMIEILKTPLNVTGTQRLLFQAQTGLTAFAWVLLNVSF